jgi:peptidoglycan/xylan/chitin deacetylase (PgdA/CDA1 family)/glycosyltransferase involved in cell wall biosynthesis
MLTVAVVIACRDDGRTLEEAVLSAQAQGERLSELIVVDDGSTDIYTRQVMLRLTRAGVRVVRTTPDGVAAARNLGVAETTAPCVMFLDADDVLVAGYLDAATTRLERDPQLAFVSCAMEEYGGGPAWRPSTDLVDGLVRAHVHVSTVIRRTAFDEVGGFEPRLPGLEDAALFAAMAARGARGLVLDDVFLRYRFRPRSRTASALETSAYQVSMAAILAQNHSAYAARWRELLLVAADHIVEQRSHARLLQTRLDALRAAASQRRSEIDLARRRLGAAGRQAVAWGDLARTTPFSDCWGLERGQPVDRVYVEAFLERHAGDIRGHVLEVKDTGYTTRYGADRVTAKSVLDIDATNTAATIIGDLTVPDTLGDEQFDCVVLTQVLNVIADAKAALANAVASLKPGGVLLCTVSALNRVSCEPGGQDGDYWRFTEAGLRHLCAELLPPDSFEVGSHGNVASCTAFLYGLASDEVPPEHLAVDDPAFPLIVTLRVVKPAQARRRARPTAGRGLVLAYHRIAAFSPDPHQLCLPPDLFEAHLHWLAAGFDVLPLDELTQRARSGALTRDAVAVTLDDGYVDHLAVAAPLAAAAGAALTCFVTTAALDEDGEFWWDAVERLVFDGDRPAALNIAVGGSQLSLDTSTSAARWRAHAALVRYCYTLDPQQRRQCLGDLEVWAGTDLRARPSRRMLRRGELVQLAGLPGITVGSHTVEHLDLQAMRRTVVVHELTDSRTALESALQTPVRLLSYPYGNADDSIADIASAAGYEYAFTVEPRAIHARDRPHLLPRLSVGSWDKAELARQVARAIETHD